VRKHRPAWPADARFYQLVDYTHINSKFSGRLKHIELAATLALAVLVYGDLVSVTDRTHLCFVPRVAALRRKLRSIARSALLLRGLTDDVANRTHHEVDAKVRQTIRELVGTIPEELPVVGSIKKI
jgi:hypothetical protein